MVAPAAAHAAPRMGAGAEDLGPLALLARYASMTRMGDRATALAAQLLKVTVYHQIYYLTWVLAFPSTLLRH